MNRYEDILSPELLNALGLDASWLGEVEAVELASRHPRAALAFAPDGGFRQILEDFLAQDDWLEQIEALDWSLPLEAACTRAMGVEVIFAREQPDLWIVSQRQGRDLEVRSLQVDAPFAGCRRSPDEPGVVYLDMELAGEGALIETAEGMVLLRRVGRECLFWPVQLAPPLSVDPMVFVESPVASWLEDCDDAWLRQELASYLDAGSWGGAVAAGLYGRLMRHSDEALARAWQKALHGGELDDEVHRAWLWAASLTGAQVDALEGLFLQEVVMLEEALAELRDQDADEGGFARAWLSFLIRRDDLEAVAALLRHGPRGRAHLDGMCEALDKAGEVMARSMDVFPSIEGHARLVRVAEEEALPGWWTIPARWP